MGRAFEKQGSFGVINEEGRRHEIYYRIVNNTIIDEKGCWIWQGSKSGEGKGPGQGYGKISINGHMSRVHRVMYMIIYGYIPNKIKVDHTCNNRLCCNPKHLEAVTHRENCIRRNKRYTKKLK